MRPSLHGVAWVFAAGSFAACGSPIGNHPDSFDFGVRGDAGLEAGRDGAREDVHHKVMAQEMPEAGRIEDSTLPTPDATGPAVDCPPNATLIYVTGEGSDLYSFNPVVGKFTLIGSMTCLSTPTHMTVDRTGTAWVVSNGDLYKASTTTAKCALVKTWTPDEVNFPDFALTFLGTTSATDDSLYILGDSGELGVFDVATGHVTSAGTISLLPSGDMTTNGDGTLYFLIQQEKQTLNELDPSNASVIESWTTGENSQDTQALAYYGGLFYDFIGTSVYTYDTQTKKVKAIGTAPIMVTGAGQSTCVPTDAGPPEMLR